MNRSTNRSTLENYLILRVRRPPRSELFPYTTLCRSAAADAHRRAARPRDGSHRPPRASGDEAPRHALPRRALRRADADRRRSEEHTSELQSRQYLVCRLLLEKKIPYRHYLACPFLLD